MKRELYPVQQIHGSLLLESLETNNHALDASATGCGKTLVAAEIASKLRRPALVVGLKSSLRMWQKEMDVRGWPAIGVINYEKLRTGNTPWGEWVPGKHWKWNIPKDTLLIWDEVQNCQGRTSLNSKLLLAAKPYSNLMLSASAAKDPRDMRALGYILGLHHLRDYWTWARRNGCAENPWGGLDFEDLEHTHLNAIHNYIFPAHGSRLSTDDLKDHFQETQIITTPLVFGPEIEKIYAEMKSEIAKLAKIMMGDSTNAAAEALIAKLRARQRVELCKVPVMLEMAELLLAEGRSVVLFVNFNDTIDALLARARLTSTKVIRGGQSAKEREDAEDSFMDNSCRLLICNSQAGGVSLSLHDVHGGHPRTSIISPDWNPKKTLQVIGRIHRAGAQTPTQQHVLFAANTVEEEVEKVVREGIEHITIINEGTKNNSEKVVLGIDPNVVLGKGDTTVSEVVSQHSETAESNLEHATWSPSALGMYEKCPGWRNRTGVAGDSDAAERGTRIHKALEKGNLDDLPDEKEKHLAQICKDFIDSQIAEHGIPEKDFREVRLTVELGAGLTTFGTCDRLLIYRKHGLMFDYKSGYRLVEDAEHNAQAWAYTIGAFEKLGLETLQFFFLIPNRDEISIAQFTRADLPRMKLRLNTIIQRAKAADPAQFSPQPELCEYCARQATCPALAQKALQVGKALAPGLPVPSNPQVSKDRVEDIPHLLRLAPLMEAWAEGVRAEALKLNLEEGVEIPGYRRQQRATNRAVSSVLGTWDLIKEKWGNISLEDFLASCSKISVPQLEDLVAGVAPKNMKGKARQALENELRARDLLNDQGTIYYLKENKQ